VRRERTWLWAILGVAFVLRLGWGLAQAQQKEDLSRLPDQVEYVTLAANLLHEGSLKFHDQRFDQDVYAYRTPGYPLFVATFGASTVLVRAAQAVLDTSTVVAAYLIARRVGRDSALIAAGIVALNPLLIYFSGLILSETLFTALLAWGVCASLHRKWWVAGVACLTAALMVRPSGLILALTIPALAAWVNREGAKAYVFKTAVAASMVFVTLGLWAYRNHRVLGQWVWTTTNEGITRYDGFNPRADGSSNQWFVREMPRLADMDEVQRNDTLGQMASDYARENPEHAGRLLVQKVARTWSPVPLSKEYGSSARYVLVGLGYTTPFFLLILAGLYVRQLPARAKVFLVAPALYFTAVHAVSVGSLRYRVPVEPELAVVAGSVIAAFKRVRPESVVN
jgi:4-amino-4-deoxy-L-arabinose transferase-like glycosyltransferase